MSDDGSPNLLNLRDFRMQKKPNFSHTDTIETCVDLTDDLTNDGLPTDELTTDIKPQIARRRILQISESDSDENNKISQNKYVVVSNKVIVERVEGTNGYTQRSKKTDAVLEKEKQMRFLREKYPKMESMAIHDILSKHDFNIENAITELEVKYGNKQPEASIENFKHWKNAQEIKEETVMYTKRSHSGENSSNARKRMKQMKSEESISISDDSGPENNDYKDRRVFDSDDDSDVEVSNELTGDKKKVLEFFRTAIPNELQLMASCSKKKVKAIMECRPFEDWIDLVKKLQENKHLSSDLLNAAQEVLSTRNNIQRLMKCCKNLAQQMERAVAAGAGVKQQPSLLDPSRHLTGYQMVGLNWLAVLHKQGVNGILADEMGLGKTIQVIAFLAHLKETGSTLGIPHLIVVPASTLDNWRVEFERWCPQLNLLMYYGSTDERRMYRVDYWSKGNINQFDVILTTYTMVTNTPEERKMFRVTQMHYVVFDEAHMLKNMNTQRYENLIRIKAKNRILLTGTPLQNNLLELMSLLIFVMPDMFAGRSDDLKNLFQKNAKTLKSAEEEELPSFEKNQINHAKDIMKPFVLRRLKQDVLQDLPKKTDELLVLPMAPTQLEQYNELVCQFQNMGKNESESTPISAMTMMSDLRKLSNHPLLLKYYYQYADLEEMAKLLSDDPMYKETNAQYITDDLLCMSDFEIHRLTKECKSLAKFELPDNLISTSGKFLFLDRKLAELKEGGHRVLIFSQYVIMLNILEEYLHIKNESYLRLDGSTPVPVRQELIDQFSNDPTIFIFLLSTRAGGLGINLTAADTVIIHDIDFNPYNDKQAEDRCHRMGQQRPVSVYRLISQSTIEEGMWQMNQEKLKLEKEVTADETENPDVKSVVRLLSSVLGIDSKKMNTLATPPQAKPNS